MNKSIGNLNSAIYTGTTYHKRFAPKVHAFSYPIYFLWLDLDEINSVLESITHLSARKWAIASFIQSDYFPKSEVQQKADKSALSLKQHIIHQAKSLGETADIDQVFLLGQIRTWGLYFSPVNFYYLYQQGHLISIVAQVSNTPWNQEHFYLVPFQSQAYCCDKTFHVSPFNHLDMYYRWYTTQPAEHLNLKIDNITNKKIFHAGISLKKQPLNNKNFNRLLIKFPWMCVKTLTAIYWQAVKLWLKGNPFYGYLEHKKQK